ncbi:HET-domain-containing protein, partial [Polyplosphaeria fusca]
METPRSANLTDQGLYQPLPSQRAIRLLRFLPGPIPKCQMVTVEVEKAPPYVALSYTWGSKSRDERIEINGIPIPITRNLFEAISGTFESTRTEHALFWADSICINQADIQERGSQVRIMNTIYRSAEFVVVWLGLAEDGTKEVFDKMQNWHKTFEKHLRKHGTELALDKTAREDRQFFMVRSSRQMKLLRDFQDLFDRPWWRRAWIVQEATL